MDCHFNFKESNKSWINLGNICNIKRGKFTFRPRNAPHLYDGKYPFLQTGNISKVNDTNDKVEFSQTLSDEGLKVSRLEKEKCVLMTIAANIGDTAILDYPACFPDSLVSIKPKDGRTSVEFLNYLLKFFRQQLIDNAPQVAQKNITLPDIENLLIPLPPLPVQVELVELMDTAYNLKKTKETEAKKILDSIDDYVMSELGIDKAEEKVEKKNFAVKVGSLFGNRIDPGYQLESKIIHKSLTKISDIAKIQGGYAFKSDEYTENGVPLVRIQSIKANGSIEISNDVCISNEKTEQLSRFLLAKNDILIAMTGATIGKIGMVDEGLPAFLNQRVGRFLLDKNLVTRKFLYNILQLQFFQIQIQKLSLGGAQPNISPASIESIQIPLPPLPIQNKIATEVTVRRARAKELQIEARQILETAKDEFEQKICD